MIKIINLEKNLLANFVLHQLSSIFYGPDDDARKLIDCHLKEALYRLEVCINNVKLWRQGEFDILHSSQYCTFLYYLANTIWIRENINTIPTKIFLLNKSLNAIDCFYEISLPRCFFIGHSVGIVLAKAEYGNNLVLYQNSTVGKNNGLAPIIEDNVILFPNSAVIGKSQVKRYGIVSQGTSIIDSQTIANKIIYNSGKKGLVFKSPKRTYISDYFREI